MKILGLESSCDETAAAIIADGVVLADIVASQDEVHHRFGGVVPELASRAHIVNVIPVIETALSTAGMTLDELDGIAVTCGPGLVGALLIALQTAKALAYAAKIPLIGIHHIEGHLSAVYLEPDPPPMPHLALVVSGGHSSLIRVCDHGDYVCIGATRDDAAGEAFDKVAKLLGLGYPGGRVIDRLARDGDPRAIELPRMMTKASTGYEFSFSGLKTAVLNWVRKNGTPAGDMLNNLCASFQATVVEVLVRKTRMAARNQHLSHVQVCGGVAANSGLRAGLAAAARQDGFTLHVPAPARCTDNAAMIAAAGDIRLRRGERSRYDLNADPNLALPTAAQRESL